MEWAVQCGEKRQNFWKIQLKVSLWWERKWGLSWQEKRSEMFHPGPFSLVKAKHQSKVRVVGGGQKCASSSNYLWGDKQLLVEQAGWGQRPRPHQARRSHHPAELWLLLPLTIRLIRMCVCGAGAVGAQGRRGAERERGGEGRSRKPSLAVPIPGRKHLCLFSQAVGRRQQCVGSTLETRCTTKLEVVSKGRS